MSKLKENVTQEDLEALSLTYNQMSDALVNLYRLQREQMQIVNRSFVLFSSAYANVFEPTPDEPEKETT